MGEASSALGGRLEMCKGAIAVLRRAKIEGELEALEQRADELSRDLGQLGRKEAAREVGQLEARLLAVDAALPEPELMGALSGGSDRERKTYTRLLAMRPIKSHSRLERFLRLARRMRDQREGGCSASELVAGLPQAKQPGAKGAIGTLQQQRERLRGMTFQTFLSEEHLVRMRKERLGVAEYATNPDVLEAFLRVETELEGRIAMWTRELQEHRDDHPELAGRSPREFVATAIRIQEQKLRRVLGEQEPTDSRSSRPSGRLPLSSRPSGRLPLSSRPSGRLPRGANRNEFGLDDDELDRVGASTAPPPMEPSAFERLRERVEDNAKASLAASLVLLVLSAGGLLLYYSEGSEVVPYGADEASRISSLLLEGEQDGQTFQGKLDAARWKALDDAGRKRAADEIRQELKGRGIYDADLHLADAPPESDPVLVIRFTVVSSIAK